MNKKPQCRKLLLVDDSLVVLSAFSTTLKSHGFLVFIASSGDEAVLKAEIIQPAVILVDLEMPEMSGLQLAEKLRELQALETTPMFLYSAKISVAQREKAKSLGGVVWVSKARVLSEGFVEKLERLVERTTDSERA